MVLGYLIRHGQTDKTTPEWWSQIGLNDLGKAQALVGAEFLKRSDSPPVWGIAPDLKRAEETLDICAKVLDLDTVKPMPELRALGKTENEDEFVARNYKAFAAIITAGRKSKRIPLIACSRSNMVVLLKRYAGIKQEVDYQETRVVRGGGIIELSTERGAVPIYGSLNENPEENLDPADGTHVSGFVTAKVNHPPRECHNCRWMQVDACHHPVTTADDELGIFYGKRRNKQGRWIVDADDCCNGFQHIIEHGT